MTDIQQPNPDLQKALEKKHTLELSLKQLIFIETVLTKIQFVYTDAIQAIPIVDLIDPIVSQEIPKPAPMPQPEKQEVIQ